MKARLRRKEEVAYDGSAVRIRLLLEPIAASIPKPRLHSMRPASNYPVTTITNTGMTVRLSRGWCPLLEPPDTNFLSQRYRQELLPLLCVSRIYVMTRS